MVLGVVTYLQTAILTGSVPMNSMQRKFKWIFGLVVISPIFEEIVFRMILISALYGVFGEWLPAIIISAIMFGGAHIFYGKTRFIDSTITGLVLGWAFVNFGIFVPILAHATHNTLATIR
jgi:membrane protease YdiL (CAAX protease family)